MKKFRLLNNVLAVAISLLLTSCSHAQISSESSAKASKPEETPAWKDKISNHHVLGGIETSRLDNGLARGVRIAWVNTGSGLRYKVVIDRALDIADAFYNQHSLVWLSYGGVVAPRPDVNREMEWLRTFTGGLMFTCGLSHTGGPESDEFEQRGLHGRISNIPAQIESIIQPDPVNGKMDMSITAVVKQTSVFGPSLELRRTISSTLFQPIIRVRDEVTNRGNAEAPHMLMYHCNFGWPLVDEGSRVLWNGTAKPFAPELELDRKTFNENFDYKTCPAPMKSHSGFGEACGIADVIADKQGICDIGVYNEKLGLALRMRYKKEQMPALTTWQHWGYGEYAVAFEPGTNTPTGQNQVRKNKTLILLAPGETRVYELEFEVLTDKKQIKNFVKKASN